MNHEICKFGFLLFLSTINSSVCEFRPYTGTGFQPTLVSFSTNSPNLPVSSNQRRSVNANINVESLLTSGSKPGIQPTIVALPLYIRNGFSSKYPSIFELLSSALIQQNGAKTMKLLDGQSYGSDILNKALSKTDEYNDFRPNYVTQRFRGRPQKSTEYDSRDEQQKSVTQEEEEQQQQRDQHIFDSEGSRSTEYSSSQKTQTPWPSTFNPNQNEYLQFSDKIYLLKAPVPHRLAPDDERKESSIDSESFMSRFGTKKFNNFKNSESNYEKPNENLESGTVGGIAYNSETKVGQREPTNHFRNHFSDSIANEDKIHFLNNQRNSELNNDLNRYTDNTVRTSTHPSDNSYESNDSRYANTGAGDESNNKNSKNINSNVNHNNGYEVNHKNYNLDSGSPPPNGYDQSSTNTNPYSLSIPINRYNPRPNFRPNYESNYVNPKTYSSAYIRPISTNDGSSLHSSVPNNYNSHAFRPMPSLNYNYDYRPLTSGANSIYSQTMSSNNQNSSQFSSNNFKSNAYNTRTESKPSFTSNPNYSNDSTDYSTPEEDCTEDNQNEIKFLSQSSKSKANSILNANEMAAKTNEPGNAESDDLDQSKLDFKIVHLPISLLRRLLGSGHMSLPGF